MRHNWTLLLLGLAAFNAAASCPTAASSSQAASQAVRPQPPASAQAHANAPAERVKVSAVASPPPALTEPVQAAARWQRHPIGAPLLVTAVVMLVIALRRGSR